MTALTATLGDITSSTADAIVNAANSSLMGGGGVDGAIHRAAGPGLLAECRQVVGRLPGRRLPVGEAVVTGGHRLAARWVVHTVGPNANAGQTDPADLAACFTSSLERAAEVGARTVAFPAVSAGIYGWAPGDVADVAVAAVRRWLAAHPDELDEVIFVLFNQPLLDEFRRALSST